ncbi:hypothetical protein DY000_02022972 [Brassica cretica]|uniref:Anaphase-promoting complex subunit 4 WD40 domain-containing protein n=1 Tax=Brassica cretica TaxID=69181 RepID=A0ABQ7EAF6_BRACR|nr:hypothetical protein DY000_02022972 [Brassica cretica]
MDFDFAHHAITEAAGGKKAEEAAVLISASKDAYRKGLAEALNLNRTRILAFRNKPQPPPPLHLSCRKELDAPGILDDFCLNLLDWGSHNVLAIALGHTLYLWDALYLSS